MRTIKNFAVTATITIAALTAASVPAWADPPVSTEVLPGIHYTAEVVDHSVVLRTDTGRLTVRDAQLELFDDSGNLAAGLPLTYKLDNKDWPIAAKVDGRTVVLTPSTNPAEAVAASVPDLKPVAAQDDFNTALAAAGGQIGLAMSMGTLIGTAVGLVGGCIAGVVVGTALMPPLFLVGAPGGCIAGAIMGAALGAAVGVVVLGVPATVVSAIQFFNALANPATPQN